ncbi:MAG: FAD-dependent oxidoreductase [Deltaproteobacteria bacterium]|nr:FAD-dependent oxidoreductase [Deltaproteobacteria bacterium]
MKETRKIFEPIEINGMKLKNRIGFAPLLNMPRAEDRSPNDLTARWFEERAKGGTGLIMTGTFNPIHPLMPGGPERFAKLADAVHAHGAKLGVQIGAGGPMGGTGPSPMPYPDEHHPKDSIFEILTGSISPMPGITSVTEFPVEQIEQYKNAFASAALALKKAGVDCVELHCAHGGATLYCSFISPFYNRREDEYGGTWEKRLRFPTETIKKMREVVGKDYPLFVRISADELLGQAGITLEDATSIIVPAMEEAGVDCLDVSQGSILHTPQGITIPMYYPRGCYIHHAEAVKKVTKLPVIGVGRIVDLDMAEKFLQAGKADIIYMGRQLTSDPETPKKYYQGRTDDIRKCIGCLEGCGTPCPINYDIAPGSIPLTPASSPKKVLIIGGGIAGMEAARVSASRGHKVTLIEKSAKLGGTVAALALDPLTAEFGNIVEYLGAQMRKLNLDVRLCKEADRADIEELNPDVIFLATGASLRIPELALEKTGVMDHIEALRHRNKIGQRVVVWGLMYGAELAVSLAEEDREVVLMGEAGENSLASHASSNRIWWVLKKLTDINAVRERPESVRVSNPEVLFHVKVKEISGGGISITNKDGKKSILHYDTLIISRGRKKNDSLFEELKGRVPEIYKIGDCSAAGNILRAVWSANETARRI